MATEATTCAGCGASVASGTRLCSECGSDLASAAYAGFWTRFLALIIDGLFLLFPNTIVGAFVDFPESTLLQALIAFAYTVGFWVGSGATPGKRAMGVVITTVDGEPVEFGTALLRYIGYIASSIVIGIGYLMIGFRGDKRGLHDLMANTVVIKKSHLEWYQRSRSSASVTPVEVPSAAIPAASPQAADPETEALAELPAAATSGDSPQTPDPESESLGQRAGGNVVPWHLNWGVWVLLAVLAGWAVLVVLLILVVAAAIWLESIICPCY